MKQSDSSGTLSPKNKGSVFGALHPGYTSFAQEVLRMGSLADVLEEKAMVKGGKIIKLYTQGMSSKDIAASLHLDLETVEDVIAEFEEE